MKLKSLIAIGLSTAVIASPSFAQDTFNPTQKKEIEQVIHNYLVKNPEVLIEASTALQQKQQRAMQEQAQVAIRKNAKALFSEKLAVAGNPKGSVTLVEFFDYQCGHCKKMKPIINALIKNDKNLRVIYKEFPIFGKSSELASKAALAAAMQGKYQKMQAALLNKSKPLDEKSIMKAAKSIGLDMSKLVKDMGSDTVKNALAANRELAEKMNLMGTPAFIVAATPNGQLKEGSQSAFIPGALSEQALQNLIKQAAQSNG